MSTDGCWRVYARGLRASGMRSNIAGSSLIPTKLLQSPVAYEQWSVWASITKLSTADWRWLRQSDVSARDLDIDIDYDPSM